MAIVDLSKLPPPDLIEELNFEAVLATALADYQARLLAVNPDAEAPLESDPSHKVLEASSYREVLLRGRGNRVALGVMLASAAGADLDQVAALFGVQRQVVTPADDTTVPPTPAVLESDARLRRRAQLAPEGFSVAGPRDGYVFHALSASADVLDAAFNSPNPAMANIRIISRETGQNGVPTQALLDAVTAALSADTVRPAGDRLTVEAATFEGYDITAELTIESGPDPQIVRAASEAALQAYADEQFRIGRNIRLSAIYAAATVPNVQNVSLAAPSGDVVTNATQAPRLGTLTVTIA